MCFLMQKYWFENSTFLKELDQTSIKSKLWCRHRVKWPSLSISTCKMAQKTYVVRYACDIYFLATLRDLSLTFSGMTFVLTQYPSQTYTNCFVGAWALRCPYNRPYSSKCDNSVFLPSTWPWPYTWPLS